MIVYTMRTGQMVYWAMVLHAEAHVVKYHGEFGAEGPEYTVLLGGSFSLVCPE